MGNVKFNSGVKRMSMSTKMLILSVALSTVLIAVFAYANQFDMNSVMVWLPLALGIGVLPYFVYQYLEYKYIQAVEEHFPDFLRALAEAQRSGINLSQSIFSAKEVDYGALSDQVKIMAAQLTWGVPFPKVIRNLETRMERSDFIRRCMSIVMEAYEAGGDVAQVMDTVAKNALVIKEMERERQAKLSQQVLVIYAVYFIFVGMIIVLNYVLGPLYKMQIAAGGGGFLGGGGGSTTGSTTSPAYYRRMFFSMMTIQGFFSGLIAGQLGEGKILAGLKHCAIMVVLGVSIFSLAIPETFLIIDLEPPLMTLQGGDVYSLESTISTTEGSSLASAQVDVMLTGPSGYLWEEETRTDTNGKISLNVPLGREAGTYKLTLTVKTDDGRIQTKSVDIGVE